MNSGKQVRRWFKSQFAITTCITYCRHEKNFLAGHNLRLLISHGTDWITISISHRDLGTQISTCTCNIWSHETSGDSEKRTKSSSQGEKHPGGPRWRKQREFALSRHFKSTTVTMKIFFKKKFYSSINSSQMSNMTQKARMNNCGDLLVVSKRDPNLTFGIKYIFA
jgi:hypothetical protein